MRETTIINDQNDQKNFRIGLMLAVGGTALFGLKSIFIKLAFAEGVDASTLLALRMMIAFPLYILIIWWSLKQTSIEQLAMDSKDTLTIIGLGFMGYYLASILDFQGLQHISAQLERLTLFTYPVMVAVLNWIIFKEKITRRLGYSLVLTYLGVIFLFSFESSADNAAVTKGTLFVALAALSFSFYVILSKQYIQRFGSLIFTSFAMLSSTLFVIIHFFVEHNVAELNVSTKVWIFAALLGILSTLIPSFMVSEAISRIGSTKTSVAGTVGPVFTILLAVFILGESFGLPQFAGMLLVVFGVLMLDVKK